MKFLVVDQHKTPRSRTVTYFDRKFTGVFSIEIMINSHKFTIACFSEKTCFSGIQHVSADFQDSIFRESVRNEIYQMISVVKR